jgi:cytochrome c oxidase subunit IV
MKTPDLLPAPHSGDRHTHEGEHGHASVGQYYIIGFVLAVLTGIEVAVFYIPTLGPALVPILLTLTTGKFALVVMFFMHLRNDSKVFSGLFLAGLLLAVFMIVSLIVLFHYLPSLEQ